MSSHHQNKKAAFISGVLLCVLVFLWPQRAASAENGEQTPTFSDGAAIAGLMLDPAEPILRPVPTTPRFTLRHVRRLGKKSSPASQMPELEPVETYGSFFGLKVTLQIKGGWNTFSGGDIEQGFSGMYDQAANLITLSGTSIVQNQKEPNHSGLEVGGDLIYCLTPRLGIGIGWGKVSAGKESVFVYNVGGLINDDLRIRPEIKVSVLRLGLFYSFPFAGRLAVTLHGGPALYNAKYSYNMVITTGSYGLDVVQGGFLDTGFYQEATAKKMGLEGGLGFEFNPNPFVAFFIEALGRYARIEGFEGEEEANYFEDFRLTTSMREGLVYYAYSDQYPSLDIVPPEGSAGGGARRAALNFSGVSFSAGLKLRF